MEFRVDIKSALEQMIRTQDKVRRGIELYGKTAAARIERRAKQDAPWTDRTSLARQTITGASGWAHVAGGSGASGGFGGGKSISARVS